MKFSVFQVSRTGGRPKNEDRMGYCYTREASLFMLADGMGGHPDGEMAAQIALQTMATLFGRHAKPHVQDERFFLHSGAMLAHHQIIRYANQHGLADSPRTTLVMAFVQHGYLHWVHCGDSRLYVLRDGKLLSRTRDHSYHEARGFSGLLRKRMNRNVLFTCLGSSVLPIIDAGGPLRLRKGDKVLLCSDGLWDSTPEGRLVTVLSAMSVAEAVPQLVQDALAKGGEHGDNVTALAFEWEGTGLLDDLDTTGFSHTGGLSDLGFPSTIDAEAIDSLHEDLDESKIEHSITEINETIERKALHRSREKTA